MRIQRQSKIWSSLTSDYVVPFFGCCGPKDEVPYVVTKWMGNGDLKSFLKDNPNKLNRLQVYLHSQKEPVYHGLLKPVYAEFMQSNILVDDNLHARISDFALAFTETPTGTRADIERTTAPEIFDGEVPGPPADVYSFGCTAYEILTDIVPMEEEKNLWKFRKRVCAGEIRPTFPSNSETAARWGLARANAPLWKLLQECWNLDPKQRPTAAEARSRWVSIMTELPT
ncbi:kinase-like domain-containing protein [Cantharellus anzutake]|uniref:kinase-like domain-containing protein n=1 Tax=Cantharellus anzutake TaxID=1750568 RepID=UPI00190779A5|nr:kinase-like domain-containing protein [Cantharellus anzutake]KAF8341405.1 kinase-like domain-containing protein [Cantharellus anzutake]